MPAPRRRWLRRVLGGAAAGTAAGALLLAVEVQLARMGERLEPRRLELDGRVEVGPPGPGPALRMVWLGDSTAAGVGASATSGALPRQVAARLGRPVELEVLATSGATVAEVVREQAGRVAAADPDVVLVSVGANDTTHLTGARDFRRRYRELIGRLPETARVVLLGIPDMGSVPRFAQPLRAIAGWRGERLDREIAALARRSGAAYVDIAGSTGPSFRRDPGRYFAADRFHPSDAGYALWADAVVDVLVRLLERDAAER